MQEPIIRDDGLQLEEERSFQRTFWIMERCAWVVFALALACAIAGLTGAGGYFSRATFTLADSRIDHPRITRWEASDEITVTFAPGKGMHRLTLGPAFFDAFEVEGVAPQPERSLATAGGTMLEFRARPSAVSRVTLYVRALRPGLPRYMLTVDEASTSVSTTVLP